MLALAERATAASAPFTDEEGVPALQLGSQLGSGVRRWVGLQGWRWRWRWEPSGLVPKRSLPPFPPSPPSHLRHVAPEPPVPRRAPLKQRRDPVHHGGQWKVVPAVHREQLARVGERAAEHRLESAQQTAAKEPAAPQARLASDGEGVDGVHKERLRRAGDSVGGWGVWRRWSPGAGRRVRGGGCVVGAWWMRVGGRAWAEPSPRRPTHDERTHPARLALRHLHAPQRHRLHLRLGRSAPRAQQHHVSARHLHGHTPAHATGPEADHRPEVAARSGGLARWETGRGGVCGRRRNGLHAVHGLGAGWGWVAWNGGGQRVRPRGARGGGR